MTGSRVKSEQPKNLRKKLRFFIKIAFLALFVCGLSYLGAIVWRSIQVYNTQSRWIGNPYRLDQSYGYFPKPNELAYHLLKYGERTAVIFDENGFRIPYPVEKSDEVPGRRILFLGDSFTHGYGVPAEKTFAYLTAKQLNASEMNAGVSGWGLSQLVLRAQDTIPKFKPDIVVVQYSKWLPERSMIFYRPSQWGISPMPYYYNSENGIDIHRPIFQSINEKLPISEYAGEDKGLFAFIWHIGVPLFVHDDYQKINTYIKSKLRFIPAPIPAKQDAINFTYKEIRSLCNEYGAKMIILVLPNDIIDRLGNELRAFSPSVVNVLPPLLKKLPEPTHRAWSSNYYFWRGDPPQMVDPHPNVQMHAEIAKILIEAISFRLPQGED